ncbi:hypothetical protein A3Q56_06110 [Intoshia linei]|uniref:Uncharacterized protein n=1 Tax=Intoshia linei TaxID=1819745 RepID=A0A177AW24_9BILA|nr:hypothetical protein A3Q56_06110 [Intoshia linei]
MPFELTFLGTGSGYPTEHRAASCIILTKLNGVAYMFDCGEGSQTQFQKSRIKPSRIKKIFITHLHGDHCFGLPGFLLSFTFKVDFLEIYGPVGLRQYIRNVLAMTYSEPNVKYCVHELVPIDKQLDSINANYYNRKEKDLFKNDKYIKKEQMYKSPFDGFQTPKLEMESDGKQIEYNPITECWDLCHDDEIWVRASYINHRVPSFGYSMLADDKIGKLNVFKLKEHGIPAGNVYRQLKTGNTVLINKTNLLNDYFKSDVIELNGQDYVGPPEQGQHVVILGDTSNSDAMINISLNCDILVHESTLDDERKDDCILKGHSTPRMAAEFANRVNAKHLILTHFSQRYLPPGVHILHKKKKLNDESESSDKLLNQAKQYFKGKSVTAAYDFLSFC